MCSNRFRAGDMYANSVRKIPSVLISSLWYVEIACLIARGHFYLFLNEKVFLFQYKYWNEIFKMFVLRICWLYGIICLVSTIWICWHYLSYLLTCKGKSLNVSHYVTPIMLRSHKSSEAYTHQVCFSVGEHLQGVAQVSWRKANCHKSQIFACEGLGNFSQKIFGEENCPDFLRQKFSGLMLCRYSEAKFELKSLEDMLPVFKVPLTPKNVSVLLI